MVQKLWWSDMWYKKLWWSDVWYKSSGGQMCGTKALVVRCVVQKPIWTKSGQPMLGLEVRLTLGLGSIIFLTSALPAPTLPGREHRHRGHGRGKWEVGHGIGR